MPRSFFLVLLMLVVLLPAGVGCGKSADEGNAPKVDPNKKVPNLQPIAPGGGGRTPGPKASPK